MESLSLRTSLFQSYTQHLTLVRHLSPGSAANNAATNKVAKYNSFLTTHHFIKIAVEMRGPWNFEASQFISELGKRIGQITLEPLETQYLFQRLPKAINFTAEGKRNSVQKRLHNRVIFMPGSTCAISDDTPNLQFLVCGFVLAGAKKFHILMHRSVNLIFASRGVYNLHKYSGNFLALKYIFNCCNPTMNWLFCKLTVLYYQALTILTEFLPKK